jgi:hypothetical protein
MVELQKNIRGIENILKTKFIRSSETGQQPKGKPQWVERFQMGGPICMACNDWNHKGTEAGPSELVPPMQHIKFQMVWRFECWADEAKVAAT